MAKIVRLHRFGGPEVLQVDEVEIAAPGPGEVRIAVAAFGLNRVETMFRNGSFGPATFPSKIGYEAAGIVESVGPGVTGFAPGDRVASLFGAAIDAYGTYGELILYPARYLTRVPDNLSLVEAAAAYMQYGTAYALVDVAKIAAGDAVVITAASSSVGLAAIQIANDAGAIPIAVTRGRDKEAALRAHGAAQVIISNEEDMAARIREITGAGARIVFDAVGGQTLVTLLSATRPAGIAIVYGLLGGYMLEMPLPALMQSNLTLRGFSANIIVEPEATRAAFMAYVNPRLAAAKFKPVISKTFPIEQIAEAHRYLEGNTQIGKIVVTTGK